MILAISWLKDTNSIAILTASGSVGFASDVVPAHLEKPFSKPQPVSQHTVESHNDNILAESTASQPQPSHEVELENPEKVVSIVQDNPEENEEEMRVNSIKRSFGFDEDMSALKLVDTEPDASIEQPISSVFTTTTSVHSQIRPVKSPNTFQPGSVMEGPVCLLAWSPLGEIECIRAAGENLIKVEFNDKSRRGFKFNDQYMFTMGCFDEHGALFGVPRRMREEWEGDGDDIVSSVVFYRPFNSWASNSSWHLNLPDGEDAECLATSEEFCAVATSLNCVRIFMTR